MACKYCQWKDKPVPIAYHGVDWPALYIDGAFLVVDVPVKKLFSAERKPLTSPINYCPVCGEKLGGDD